MNLFLAGPMSDMPNENRPAFMAAAAELEALGHKVFNPGAPENIVPGWSWAQYVSRNVAYILQTPDLDGIVLLPGWTASKGALLEAIAGYMRGIQMAQPMNATWACPDGLYWLGYERGPLHYANGPLPRFANPADALRPMGETEK